MNSVILSPSKDQLPVTVVCTIRSLLKSVILSEGEPAIPIPHGLTRAEVEGPAPQH